MRRWRIGIIGEGDRSFIDAARERFSGRPVIIEPVSENGGYDAVLVLPDARLPESGLKCRILVIPENTSVSGPKAKTVVSYGMSQRNTVTLSSTEDHDHVIALQRDVPSLKDTLIQRQEFGLLSELPPYETLALASLLIVSGEIEQ